ncbi:CAP domain-containing protein [Wielerella bovis]|uniref:CAP domain-containing protein n=1 Tax=Wielerella bovis TaxID=2917790 RepID=UPI0020188A32|nr:CAP domain-containing protein [Wielerella bovis]MCG7656938.1 CAP domain-containing protein [Wielerella bovis]MCG7659161.1 CAP domain-containing protein [Wielerella bovis]ULJ70186.1 CAP domain-containing protein [Wielerella bovis]
MSKKRRRHTATQSSLSLRIIWFWIPVCIAIFSLVYLSQKRFNPQREAQAGLQQLNYWRNQAGLMPLTRYEMLEESAQNHAKYLSKDAHGHDELNTSNPFFTGETPQVRATAVGYSAPIAENLTIGNFARSGKSSIDGLMTAIYHRLSLLNPNHDEAGAAWANGKYNAFVVNQGSSYDREVCDTPPNGKRYIMTMPCRGKSVEIHLDTPPPSQEIAVKFPIGENAEPKYDGKETPNPMPHYDKTGNPVSIAFYGQKGDIRMEDFQIFAPNGEITKTEILTVSSDPNNLLSKTEFALFPIEPLAFDTEYRVAFHYHMNGEKKLEEWTFRTRKKRHWFEW